MLRNFIRNLQVVVIVTGMKKENERGNEGIRELLKRRGKKEEPSEVGRQKKSHQRCCLKRKREVGYNSQCREKEVTTN
jgi:hypothetical protein